MVDSQNEQTGRVSGWSVDEDPDGGFRWTAFGPAGTVQGRAPTRAKAERAAVQAEQDLEEERSRARLDRSAGRTPRPRSTGRLRRPR